MQKLIIDSVALCSRLNLKKKPAQGLKVRNSYACTIAVAAGQVNSSVFRATKTITNSTYSNKYILLSVFFVPRATICRICKEDPLCYTKFIVFFLINALRVYLAHLQAAP